MVTLVIVTVKKEEEDGDLLYIAIIAMVSVVNFGANYLLIDMIIFICSLSYVYLSLHLLS